MCSSPRAWTVVTEGVPIGRLGWPTEALAAQPETWRDKYRKGEGDGVARRLHKLVQKHYVDGPSLKPIAWLHSPSYAVPKPTSDNITFPMGIDPQGRGVFDMTLKKRLEGMGLNYYLADGKLYYPYILFIADRVMRNNWGWAGDVSCGFHNIPVHPEDRKWLGYEFRHPTRKDVRYFGQYRTLPMGMKTSSALFTYFSASMVRAARCIWRLNEPDDLTGMHSTPHQVRGCASRRDISTSTLPLAALPHCS